MRQLVQKLRDGRQLVLEVPEPALGPGMALVRNRYSLISVGTESSTVRAARKGLIGKAMDRPGQVRQALEVLATQGPIQAYRAVTRKLDAYSPLGYSASGVVEAVAPGVIGLGVGDLAACGGVAASHSEVVAVQRNLCVRLHPEADLRLAAYNTLGAIAMQGVRQAGLQIGETAVVIGLGLIGHLTGLILRASGVRVMGLDINAQALDMARGRCADLAIEPCSPGLRSALMDLSGGIGADAVIITAQSDSTAPINLAGELLRRRGRVVVVGDVPTGFDREGYYRKELELRMSCSYGPGRYDPEYEEHGRDYPVGYVRWTEGRNMEAFQALASEGRLGMDYMTTHVFPIERAPEAYEMILARSEPFLGVLIEYPEGVGRGESRMTVRAARRGAPAKATIGFIGAGGYASGYLLPNIPRARDVELRGVVTSSGASARAAAERFGFAFCSTDPDDVLCDQDINTIFVATRHDSHSGYVAEALRRDRYVFVEKPLAITRAGLDDVRRAYEGSAGWLMVGYNRRFSPLTVDLMGRMEGAGPCAMLYRVNAGPIAPDSWIQDPERGGGRLIGEACHFLDLMSHICGAAPASLETRVMAEPGGRGDTAVLLAAFEDGSVGTIAYYANGSRGLQKEYLEVHRGGISGVIEDFRELRVHVGGKPYRRRLAVQDKGQAAMVEAFLGAVRQGGGPPIPVRDTFAVADWMLRSGRGPEPL